MSNYTLLPAIKGFIGDWTYFSTILSMEFVSVNVNLANVIHEVNNLDDMIQRALENRSGDISRYLLENQERFFNALIIGVYDGTPQWFEVGVTENDYLTEIPEGLKNIFGYLAIDKKTKLFAIDGQHRVVGIREAIAQNEELLQDEVPAIFVTHMNSTEGKIRTRRLFTTLNKYAKKVDPFHIIALDEDDIVAIITRKLVMHNRLFLNKTGKTKQKGLSNDKRNFTSIITLWNCMEFHLQGRRKSNDWKKFRNMRPNDVTITKYYDQAVEIWDTICRYFPEINTIKNAEPRPKLIEEYRNQDGGNLLFRPAGLTIFFNALFELRKTFSNDEEIVEKLSNISYELNSYPWENLLWNNKTRKMLVSKTNQNLALKLLYYYVGGDLNKFGSSSRYRINLDALIEDYEGTTERDFIYLENFHFKI